jgi:Tfp pilus assembly protein PilX
MRTQPKQSGATLVVSLIMLVVLMLLVVAALRYSNTNLRIVGNMQLKTETSAAAQQAIEQVIDANTFVSNPIVQNITVNTGAASYTVTTTPTCVSTRPVTNDELDVINNPLDQYCLNGTANGALIEGSTGNVINTDPSACLDQQWNISATANDTNSGTTTTVNQGIARRVEIGTSC